MNTEIGKHYDEVIRNLIDKENTTRNQRTNWFLLIQGFLVAAFCDIINPEDFTNNGNILVLHLTDFIPITSICILFVICLIGLLSSISFLYAAWRSEKAMQMLLRCWDIFRLENKKSLKDYPPVIALTKPIIENERSSTGNEKLDEDINKWNKCIHDMMRPHLTRKDVTYNKLEFLLPYKFIPCLFSIIWLIGLFALIFWQIVI